MGRSDSSEDGGIVCGRLKGGRVEDWKIGRMEEGIEEGWKREDWKREEGLRSLKQKTPSVQRWVTYSPSRLGNNLAYATVFDYAFTSGFRQKTTMIEGGQPILLTGQQAAWHTQQFSADILLLVSIVKYILFCVWCQVF